MHINVNVYINIQQNTPDKVHCTKDQTEPDLSTTFIHVQLQYETHCWIVKVGLAGYIQHVIHTELVIRIFQQNWWI